MKDKIRQFYSDFIVARTYARWNDEERRRETWDEIVDRYENYVMPKIPEKLIPDFKEAVRAIKAKEIMPSMRMLWTAGPAADADNICIYNCTTINIDCLDCFHEIMYLLMNGVGVGLSVERQFISKLPEVSKVEYPEEAQTYVVGDSKEGWALAYKALLKDWYNGIPSNWDVSQVRPKGAIIKKFGGRACLTGDTLVYKDRKKTRNYNSISIRDLYNCKHHLGFWKGKPGHFKDIKLRSLSEKDGVFYRNQLIDVIYNGKAPVYEITTEKGYRIKATGNHRFMRDTGEYQYVDNFNIGDLIAVNGSKERRTGVCIDCGMPIYPRATRCKSCANKAQLKDTALETTARQRKQCRKYMGTECERCGATNTRLTIHHKDKNVFNNDWSNLETLCEKCHQVHHAKENTYGDPYSHKYLSYDKIISINYAGIEDVYDLQMEAPDHNFVANGFVSHNSGPGPLIDLFTFAKRVIFNAKGRKLNSAEVADICCKTAEVIIAGGTRRSALLISSNLSDQRMKIFKEGQFWIDNPQRALANISTAYTEKPDVAAFMDEWQQLYQSKAGERGIINVEAFPDPSMRLNPCLSGESIVLTPAGIATVDEVSEGTLIWSEDGWVRITSKVHTKDDEVWLYQTQHGSVLCTENHKIVEKGKKVEAKDAKFIDRLLASPFKSIEHSIAAIVDGIVCARGKITAENKIMISVRENEMYLFDKPFDQFILKEGRLTAKYDKCNIYSAYVNTTITPEEFKLMERSNSKIPVRYYKEQPSLVASFLRGYLSLNAKVTAGRIEIQANTLYTANMIVHMLSSLGIHSKVKFSNSLHAMSNYRIMILKDMELFYKNIGFMQKLKQKALKAAITANPVEITNDKIVHKTKQVGIVPVYDITVDGDSHTFWSGGLNISNCGERILYSCSACNLSEVVVTKHISFMELERRVKLATLLGTIQATYTKFNLQVLRKDWIENSKREAMLGVSLTGTSNRTWSADELERLKGIAKISNEKYSRLLGIRQATGITCNKPSGSVSQVVGTASGIHPDFSKFYIRRVRVAVADPLCKMLMDQKIPWHPEVGSTEENMVTAVFEFPLEGKATRIASEVNAREQLEYYKLFKDHWCDSRGNPSTTIYVKENEWFDVQAWVYKNWDSIGGLSFLPQDNNVYQLAPYEAITEEKFNELVEAFPKDVDLSQLAKYELDDRTEGAKSYACTAGGCEV